MIPQEVKFSGFPHSRLQSPQRDKAHHVGHARPQEVTLLPGMFHQGLHKGGVGPYRILDVGHHLDAVLANIPTSLQRRGGEAVSHALL